MRRYVTRPRAWIDEGEYDWYGPGHQPDLTVYERDRSPIPTGLYDANGDELYAMDEREPIGFVHLKERI